MSEKLLKRTKSACLARVLVSECGELSDEVKDEVEVFQVRNLEWIKEAFLAEYRAWSEEKAD